MAASLDRFDLGRLGHQSRQSISMAFWTWIFYACSCAWVFWGYHSDYTVSAYDQDWLEPASRWSLWLTWNTKRIGSIFRNEKHARGTCKGTNRAATWCPSFVAIVCLFFPFVVKLASLHTERLRMLIATFPSRSPRHVFKAAQNRQIYCPS